MNDFGKKITGLLGADKVDELKKFGVDAVGDFLGKTLNKSSDEPEADAPPAGKPVTDFAPPTSAKVEDSAPADVVAAPTAVNVSDSKSAVDKIIELNGLREKGLITDAEFTALKNALLN